MQKAPERRYGAERSTEPWRSPTPVWGARKQYRFHEQHHPGKQRQAGHTLPYRGHAPLIIQFIFMRIYNNDRLKQGVPVNIEDRDDCYRLTLYAAGFPEAAITISVISDTLVIKGCIDEYEEGQTAFIKQEYPINGFERRLFLDNKVETDCISTRFKQGVLTVFLPKKNEGSLLQLQKQMDIAIPG